MRLRCEDREEPEVGEPSEGTDDSVPFTGPLIGGSDDRTRGAVPAAPAAGSVTMVPEPEPQLVHGAAVAWGMV